MIFFYSIGICWTRFCYVTGSKVSGITVHALSDSLRIYFFPLWRADPKISGFAAELAGLVGTEAVSGGLKLPKFGHNCDQPCFKNGGHKGFGRNSPLPPKEKVLEFLTGKGIKFGDGLSMKLCRRAILQKGEEYYRFHSLSLASRSSKELSIGGSRVKRVSSRH